MTEEEKLERQDIAYQVRVWEAACKIEHPTPNELGFREAIAKKLAKRWQLKELRTVEIAPATPAHRR